MPIHVAWDDDAHTTLHFAFLRPWTWDQYFEAIAVSQQWIETSPHRVYTISDTRSAGPLPPNSMMHIRRSIQALSPQTGGTVAVGVSTPIRVIVELFQRMNIPIAQQWTIAANMEEARAIIAGWKAQENANR